MKKYFILYLIFFLIVFGGCQSFEAKLQKCPEVIYGDNFENNTSIRIVSIEGQRIDESKIDWDWVRENCN